MTEVIALGAESSMRGARGGNERAAAALFARYPKVRPPLPESIARIYAAHYKENREGRSLASAAAQRVESWLHRQVARDVRPGTPPKSTLELGSGTLNQLAYEPENPAYDIVEPFRHLYENSALLGRIRHAYVDIREVPTELVYDRITSVATLEHICDLPEVIARSALLLEADGVFRAAIPSEGTAVWTLGWKLTTGLEFRWRHRLDYGLLMQHEHVNKAREIEDVLRFFFSRIRVRFLGLSRSVSLYQFFECRGPIQQRAHAAIAYFGGQSPSKPGG
jgi:hypothetical protein